jgi:hypothetical protein
MTSLESLPDDQHSGHGLVADDHEPSGERPVSDFLRDLPPGAGGSGI